MQISLALALVLSSTVSQTGNDPTPAAPSSVIGPTVRFGDYDGDGLLDAYVVNPTSGDRLLRNLGDGNLADVTVASGLSGILGSRLALWQDYDRDGSLDLFVCSSEGRSRLMRNVGGGVFADVTYETGIAHVAESDLFAEWIDYDADGLPDLHVATDRGDELYHNRGRGRFEPVNLLGGWTNVTQVLVPAEAFASNVGAPASGRSMDQIPRGGDRRGDGSTPDVDRRPTPPGGASTSSATIISATPTGPYSGGTQAVPFCEETIRDQATSGCIQASSTPTLGLLYPLSSNLFVGATGKVGVGTTSPSANLHVAGVDGLLATGTFGSGTIPASGAGTRLMWYPSKAAFRAGSVSGAQWDDANIGDRSTAMGSSTTAGGSTSTAMGSATTASGNSSTAMGFITTASGSFSTAMGHGTTASFLDSTAMGNGTTAGGTRSTAMGDGTTATGTSSTSMGSSTTASGFKSTAMGDGTTASGTTSTAMGLGSKAESHVSVALGRYNVGGGDPATWVSTDPLFEIGNGTSSAVRTNALTVLKSGSVGIGTPTPGNPLHAEAAGTASGGVAGFSEVVARFQQSTSDQHGAVSVDAPTGRDSVLYLAENGAAVWDVRNDSSASDDFNIRYQGGGGNTTVLTIETSGDVGIGRSPAANKLEVEGNASKTAAGSWLANSDRRIKTEIRDVQGALDTIDRVRPVVFRYTDEYRAEHPSIEDQDYYNVIAQEFAETFPEYVKPSGEGDILQVDTYPMLICAVAAVKELHAKDREKEGRIAELEERLRAQSDRMASLEVLMTKLVAAAGGDGAATITNR